MAKCVNGHDNTDGQKFCGECGAAIVEDQAAAPAEDAAAAAVPEPTIRGRSRRPLLIGALGAVAVAAIAGGLVVALSSSGGPDSNTQYISSLRKAGLLNKFASRATAIAKGKHECRSLKNGSEPQGSAADKVAVRFYCHSFLKGFHVLETAKIQGLFTLTDSNPNPDFPSIDTFGGTCKGSGGYSDIGPGTTVVVKNGAGRVVAQTALGAGVGDASNCLFTFTFKVTEGEDQYLVSVSHRGELSFTFSQLKSQGVALTLGN